MKLCPSQMVKISGNGNNFFNVQSGFCGCQKAGNLRPAGKSDKDDFLLPGKISTPVNRVFEIPKNSHVTPAPFPGDDAVEIHTTPTPIIYMRAPAIDSSLLFKRNQSCLLCQRSPRSAYVYGCGSSCTKRSGYPSHEYRPRTEVRCDAPPRPAR